MVNFIHANRIFLKKRMNQWGKTMPNENKKWCPLLSMTPAHAVKQDCHCCESECAWWHEFDKCCAMVAIASKSSDFRAQSSNTGKSSYQSADTGKMVPIALDELREMDGEPVWCDWMNAWAFVNIDGAREINFTYRDGSQNTFCELAGFCGKYGKKWAAYRTKPEAPHET